MEQVSQVLVSKGISISDAEIYMLIESAVYGLNEGWLKENKSIELDNSNEKSLPDTDVIKENQVIE